MRTPFDPLRQNPPSFPSTLPSKSNQVPRLEVDKCFELDAAEIAQAKSSHRQPLSSRWRILAELFRRGSTLSLVNLLHFPLVEIVGATFLAYLDEVVGPIG